MKEVSLFYLLLSISLFLYLFFQSDNIPSSMTHTRLLPRSLEVFRHTRSTKNASSESIEVRRSSLKYALLLTFRLRAEQRRANTCCSEGETCGRRRDEDHEPPSKNERCKNSSETCSVEMKAYAHTPPPVIAVYTRLLAFRVRT